jgi:hypothetical protein
VDNSHGFIDIRTGDGDDNDDDGDDDDVDDDGYDYVDDKPNISQLGLQGCKTYSHQS